MTQHPDWMRAMFAWRLFYQRNRKLVARAGMGLALFAVALAVTMPIPRADAVEGEGSSAQAVSAAAAPTSLALGVLLSGERLERVEIVFHFSPTDRLI